MKNLHLFIHQFDEFGFDEGKTLLESLMVWYCVTQYHYVIERILYTSNLGKQKDKIVLPGNMMPKKMARIEK